MGVLTEDILRNDLDCHFDAGGLAERRIIARKTGNASRIDILTRTIKHSQEKRQTYLLPFTSDMKLSHADHK